MAQVRPLHAPLELGRQVAAVVEVIYGKAALIPAELCHPGVHEQGQALRVGNVKASHPAEHAADGDAVGGDDQGLVRVLLHRFQQSRIGPVPHLGVGLRPVQLKMGLVKNEFAEILLILTAEIAEIHGLPGTQVYLPEAPVGVYGQGVILGDGRGGKAGSVQVAGIYGVHMDVFKTLRQRIPLLHAHGGNVPVPVALAHSVEVALRLDVANYINFCHKYASCFLTICTEYSIIHWIICQPVVKPGLGPWQF